MEKGIYVVIDDGSLDLFIDRNPSPARKNQSVSFPYGGKVSKYDAYRDAELYCEKIEKQRCKEAGLSWSSPKW